jgi:hypothetical protein
MMSENIKIKKYCVLQTYFPKDEMNSENWSFWIANISKIIFEQKQLRGLYILTLGQNESNSIGFDIGAVWKVGKFNSVKYLVTDLSTASIEDITLMIDTDEFYLGSIILLLEKPSEDEIKKIIILWNRDLINSGVEFFKMDSDGNCFYWYNPKYVNEAEKILNTNLSQK